MCSRRLPSIMQTVCVVVAIIMIIIFIMCSANTSWCIILFQQQPDYNNNNNKNYKFSMIIVEPNDHQSSNDATNLLTLSEPSHDPITENNESIEPVFGILAQPLVHSNCSACPTHPSQYIAASYIKWLEMGGIRTIPIPYDVTNTRILDDMFDQVNGLFLPGGESHIPFAIEYLLNRSIASNLYENLYFPVWGTCLGYEFILEYIGSNFGKESLDHHILESDYEAFNISLSLDNVVSKELYPAGSRMYALVSNDNVTFNNHHQGISSKRFYHNPYLSKYFFVTSTNIDRRTNKEFVSTIEPIYPHQFPIYGIQYHPEKNTFEYSLYPNTTIPYEAINHTPNGIEFSFILAQFIGQLGRNAVQKQKQQTTTIPKHTYTKPNVYPLVTSYPIIKGIAFEEIYIIPPATTTTIISSTIS